MCCLIMEYMAWTPNLPTFILSIGPAIFQARPTAPHGCLSTTRPFVHLVRMMCHLLAVLVALKTPIPEPQQIQANRKALPRSPTLDHSTFMDADFAMGRFGRFRRPPFFFILSSSSMVSLPSSEMDVWASDLEWGYVTSEATFRYAICDIG